MPSLSPSPGRAGFTLLLAIAGGAFDRLELPGSHRRHHPHQLHHHGRRSVGKRIPARGTNDEIDQLVASLTAMLTRIQQLMDGLRQVSSDIAHDLRTPLGACASIRRCPRAAKTTAEYDAATTNSAIAEADVLLETFGLLRIAQIEAGAARSAFSQVDPVGAGRAALPKVYRPAAEDAGPSASNAGSRTAST